MFCFTVDFFAMVCLRLLKGERRGRLRGMEGSQGSAEERERLVLTTEGETEDGGRLSPHHTADVELEIEGEVVDAGGQGEPNILMRNDHGTYTISVPREVQASLNSNILYQTLHVLVKCKYDVVTKEFRDYELKEIVEPGEYDEEVMTEVVKRGTADWKGVEDPCLWVSELRGEDQGKSA